MDAPMGASGAAAAAIAVAGALTDLPVAEPHGDLGSVAQSEFGEDVLDMVLGGSLRDERPSAIC